MNKVDTRFLDAPAVRRKEPRRPTRVGQSYFVRTFGCQMNVADSNDVAERFIMHGIQAIDDPAKADLIVVNTCSVREHAEQRAKARIR